MCTRMCVCGECAWKTQLCEILTQHGFLIFTDQSDLRISSLPHGFLRNIIIVCIDSPSTSQELILYFSVTMVTLHLNYTFLMWNSFIVLSMDVVLYKWLLSGLRVCFSMKAVESDTPTLAKKQEQTWKGNFHLIVAFAKQCSGEKAEKHELSLFVSLKSTFVSTWVILWQPR